MHVMLSLAKGHLSNKDRVVWQKGVPIRGKYCISRIKTSFEQSREVHNFEILLYFDSLQYLISVVLFFVPSPRGKYVSTEVQCGLTPSTNLVCSQKLEEQLKEGLQRNAKLAEELGAAKKEIEILKGRLREYEVRAGDIKCPSVI